MIKKSLRNAVAGTGAAAVLILPTATTVAPQVQLQACAYPDSIVTQTDLSGATDIDAHTTHIATVDVDAGSGQPKPQGRVRFKVKGGKTVWEPYDGPPVKFEYGGAFKAGREYTLKAKFFGKCKWRNSSDQMVVTVRKP